MKVMPPVADKALNLKSGFRPEDGECAPRSDCVSAQQLKLRGNRRGSYNLRESCLLTACSV